MIWLVWAKSHTPERVKRLQINETIMNHQIKYLKSLSSFVRNNSLRILRGTFVFLAVSALVFGGFFVPYLGKKERQMLKQTPKSKLKEKKIKVNVAILGGGDVVFPIILAGVVLRSLGLIPALIVSFGAALALAVLFYISEKGKFYPAMPFITAGCFIGLVIAYLI